MSKHNKQKTAKILMSISRKQVSNHNQQTYFLLLFQTKSEINIQWKYCTSITIFEVEAHIIPHIYLGI